MSITTQKEDDIIKVFMKNTYVGYIEGDELYAFDRENRAQKIDGIDKFDIASVYMTMRGR